MLRLVGFARIFPADAYTKLLGAKAASLQWLNDCFSWAVPPWDWRSLALGYPASTRKAIFQIESTWPIPTSIQSAFASTAWTWPARPAGTPPCSPTFTPPSSCTCLSSPWDTLKCRLAPASGTRSAPGALSSAFRNLWICRKIIRGVWGWWPPWRWCFRRVCWGWRWVRRRRPCRIYLGREWITWHSFLWDK